MIYKCSECKHELFCKYVENYKVITAEIDDLLKSLKTDNVGEAFLTLDIRCRFFMENGYIKNPIDWSKPIDPFWLDRTAGPFMVDPCINCTLKPDMSKGVYIGDSACDWCQYNKFKPTVTNK